MIARYEIDSCKTRFEERESRHGKTRIDEFALALDAYKMPVVRGSKSIVYGKAATMAEDFRDHEPSIRCVSVRDDGCVQAEYLTAKCPFCGQDNELRHDSQLVGAAEMNDERTAVVQAKARYNHPIDSNPLLQHAFASWLKDKELQYEPHPWNE